MSVFGCSPANAVGATASSPTPHRARAANISKFGQWITIKRVRVGAGDVARFTLPLDNGVHKLRIATSVNQAGVGYLGAFSNEVRWRTV